MAHFSPMSLVAAVVLSSLSATAAFAQTSETSGTDRPNILIIMGDDIGYWNLSYNNDGMMGYRTPSIDRIATEGVTFTDYYGEQSCTAGRAALITGQSGIRTGLLKVGIPASPIGIQEQDPTLAVMLKDYGYRTGQFGKNHLGDRNEFLPTVHGFDEFFGNLYHLPAEEEPENEGYPQDPRFKQNFGPRGILKCVATDTVDETEDPRFGRVGAQRCEDSGPLTRERMETVDQEFVDASSDFMQRAVDADEPFFVWHNATRMHYYTNIGEEYEGRSGLNFYADGMLEHDDDVGELLAKLDELGVADNTIVLYTTDNGPHYNQWPDGGITPFRGEKNTNWEGAFRVPAAVRWPASLPAGVTKNGIVSHKDWVPTILAAIGADDVKEKLLEGHEMNGREYRVHLDGFNMLPYLTGEAEESPRDSFFYLSDEGQLLALRLQRYKAVFAEQRSHGFAVWRDPFVQLRAPKFFDLRMDPFERGDTDSNNWEEWWSRHLWLGPYLTDVLMRNVATLAEYPPSQRVDSWNAEEIIKRVQESPAQ